MLRLIVTVLAFSAAWAQLHSICFSNHQGHTEDEVINRVADMADLNKDNIIKEGEVVVAVARILNIRLPVDESIVLGMDYQALLGAASFLNFHIKRDYFVTTWHSQFHDNVEFISAVFDAFDDNKDAEWDVAEVDGIIQHMLSVSDDGDRIISRAEFVHFFEYLYKSPDCE